MSRIQTGEKDHGQESKKLHVIHHILTRNEITDNINKYNNLYWPFVDNMKNPIYKKQFSFPSFMIDTEMRIDIIKASTHFALNTNRFNEWSYLKLQCDKIVIYHIGTSSI